MTTAIFANPGQSVNICIQSVDGYGRLADGYQAPTVDFIRMPSGSNASGYPTSMTQIVTGLWRHSFTLPSGTAGLGTFIISCSWPHPDTGYFQNETFLINVALPFGNTSVSPA